MSHVNLEKPSKLGDVIERWKAKGREALVKVREVKIQSLPKHSHVHYVVASSDQSSRRLHTQSRHEPRLDMKCRAFKLSLRLQFTSGFLAEYIEDNRREKLENALITTAERNEEISNNFDVATHGACEVDDGGSP
jgi:glutamate mutase epsilon subunit